MLYKKLLDLFTITYYLLLAFWGWPKINLARINIINYTKITNNPIISIENVGSGSYKKIIKQALSLGISKFTLKEYDKKIVSFCDKLGIIVEDDYKYLPQFFYEQLEEKFREKGPLNLGVLFDNKDRKLANKILKEVCVYARFITIPNCINAEEIAKNIFIFNGIIINIEKDIEKICKKCDIIIDIKKCQISQF